MSLFQSRKFWIALVTAVFDITLVVVATYFPEQQDFVQAVLAPVNGLAMVVIAGIALEDAALKRAG